jgi:hypothetical protein
LFASSRGLQKVDRTGAVKNITGKTGQAKKKKVSSAGRKKNREVNLMETYHLLVKQWYDMFSKLP